MLERAHTIAEEVLFPAAVEVDARGVIPRSHFDLLAEEGFYGLAGGPEHGGLRHSGIGVDIPALVGILEALVGGCLATTFTWMQHHGVVRGLTGTANAELRDKYLHAAIRGEVRGGVAYAGAIPQPPRLWATATGSGWLLNGEAPLVTGWDIVDVLQISARNTAIRPGEPAGTIISGLVDATGGSGIDVEPLRMVAAQGSNTVRLRFTDYVLPVEKVIAEVSHREFLAKQLVNARLNGCLAMGVARRCIKMIGEAGRAEIAELLHIEHGMIRQRLDGGLAEPATMPAARAAASEHAYRCAGALVVAVGSSGILARQHAQRLVREATFTLVAAGRPEIKDRLLKVLGQVHE
ncbi:MAG TPA: acyl-CoA dehydrogenase family protein [Pseudonocardiaceae bacterium]|jgi:alkylation response protein AidB-like acyl-CoA dehydrogenase|nr:acyl-CoA dehydrogenase family protein [Pseudonocardiaceae bacterium]